VKIALVYPSIYSAGFNTGGAPVLFSQSHAGLATLSAVCKKEGFRDIKLIDLRAFAGWESVRSGLRAYAPDVIGITMMSPDFEYAMKFIDAAKEECPRAKIVAGGMHPTVMTEEVESNPKIDHIMTGEGETKFIELLRALDAAKPYPRLIKGELADVDKLPFIDRELFDFLELPYDFFLELPFATILAGRGCMYNCHFCSPAGKLMHGYRIRRRSVGNVIEELSYLKETYGIKSFQFWDDCFTEDPRWVDEFCAVYIRKKIGMPFVCQTRADIICKRPDMMRKLSRTGLKMASIGFESGSDRLLKFINKGTTVKMNIKAAAICKRAGVKIWAYHMYGLPTETREESLQTVKMIRKISPYRSSAAFFTPHPGSFLFDYCRKNDLSLIDHHDNFVRFPEEDKAKIKGIDYEHLRMCARASKEASFAVKARIRIERVLWHKKNKAFRLKFTELAKKDPSTNKMALLRQAHSEGKM